MPSTKTSGCSPVGALMDGWSSGVAATHDEQEQARREQGVRHEPQDPGGIRLDRVHRRQRQEQQGGRHEEERGHVAG